VCGAPTSPAGLFIRVTISRICVSGPGVAKRRLGSCLLLSNPRARGADERGTSCDRRQVREGRYSKFQEMASKDVVEEALFSSAAGDPAYVTSDNVSCAASGLDVTAACKIGLQVSQNATPSGRRTRSSSTIVPWFEDGFLIVTRLSPCLFDEVHGAWTVRL
jgi:hypothetical protein